MNSTDLIVIILTQVVALVVLYFTSYLKEKGSNLAKKEDIALLTREVENVKNELTYKTQFNSKLFEETKIATIDAFERLANLHDTIIFPHYFYEIDNPKIKEIEANNREVGEAFNRALARLNLYVGNSEMYLLFCSCAKKLSKLNSDIQPANYSKRDLVEFKRQIGNVEEHKTVDNIDFYSNTLKAIEVGTKISAEDAQRAGTALKDFKEQWTIEKEKLRQCVSDFITGKKSEGTIFAFSSADT